MKKVITFGVFDLFHIGHLNLFENIKNVCGTDSYLIVGVQNGEYIKKYKPNANIYYSTKERIRLIKSLRVVDEVIEYEDVDKTIKKVDFNIFAIGEDQNHSGFQNAVTYCEDNNKKVVRMQRTKNICSSSIKADLNNKSFNLDEDIAKGIKIEFNK